MVDQIKGIIAANSIRGRFFVRQMKDKKVQWTEVAHLLFEKSNETFFRTAKHCRERWLNELDP